MLRSLFTLKALAHWETGGIVAAGTTSLPEQPGGPRNWDYRYCWLRDATFTLYALIGAGFVAEADAWRQWLLRAVAGAPNDLQIMYGVAGERRLDEYEVPWLPGYEGAKPVRIGNAAVGQLQLDVYGEVLDAFYVARRAGLAASDASWALECALLDHLETIWRAPDEGIWEVRGGRKHFTHSKVMAWVAFDRGVRSIEEFGWRGPLDRWRARSRDDPRGSVRTGVRRKAEHFRAIFRRERDSTPVCFSSRSSASCRPRIHACAARSPRLNVICCATAWCFATTQEREPTGCRPAKAHFSPAASGSPTITCWRADTKRRRALFERLLALRNDVGLLAEEYDPRARRQLGNFPQAFSHLALINTARNLASANGPAAQRASRPNAEPTA